MLIGFLRGILEFGKKHFLIVTGISVLFAVLSVVSVFMIHKHWYPPVFKLTEQDLGKEALFETNYGNFSVTLNRSAPFAVSQFTRLGREGFYDGTKIHRIVKDLLIEGGDPLTKVNDLKKYWGQGGSDAVFKNETHVTDKMLEGTLVMAGSEQGTYGSHFFIVTKNTPWMVGKHTIIGQTKDGLDVIHKIEAVETNVSGTPVSDVEVYKITIL